MENIKLEIDYEQPDVIINNESSVIRTDVFKDDIEIRYNLETNELTKNRISTYSNNSYTIKIVKKCTIKEDNNVSDIFKLLEGENIINSEKDFDRYLGRKIKVGNNRQSYRINLIKILSKSIIQQDLISEKDTHYNLDQISIQKHRDKNTIILDPKRPGSDFQQQIVKDSMSSIMKSIADTNDYGLDEGFIYLNILANVNQKSLPLLSLYKCNNPSVKFLSKIDNGDDFKQELAKLFNCREDGAFSLGGKEKQFIPVFENGHISVLILKQGNVEKTEYTKSGGARNTHEKPDLFVLDSQKYEDVNVLCLNDKYNFQTKINTGCCGFFSSFYTIELLNNLEKYESLFTAINENKIANNYTQEQKDLLGELHIITAMQVSNNLDKENCILKEGIQDEQSYINFKINNQNFAISKNCDKSKCVNIGELTSFLKDVNNIDLTQQLHMEIEKQNRINEQNGAKKYNDNRIFGNEEIDELDVKQEKVINEDKKLEISQDQQQEVSDQDKLRSAAIKAFGEGITSMKLVESVDVEQTNPVKSFVKNQDIKKKNNLSF